MIVIHNPDNQRVVKDGMAGTSRTYACGEVENLYEAGSFIFYKME